jgi:hypothetical protein
MYSSKLVVEDIVCRKEYFDFSEGLVWMGGWGYIWLSHVYGGYKGYGTQAVILSPLVDTRKRGGMFLPRPYAHMLRVSLPIDGIWVAALSQNILAKPT